MEARAGGRGGGAAQQEGVACLAHEGPGPSLASETIKPLMLCFNLFAVFSI